LRGGSPPAQDLPSSLGARAEYAALKAVLAERHRFDREAYTEPKGPVIQRILERAVGVKPD
jgi:GrpB-like predicted nucleotidyltransferase (UPF0157 family)